MSTGPGPPAVGLAFHATILTSGGRINADTGGTPQTIGDDHRTIGFKVSVATKGPGAKKGKKKRR